MGKRDDLYGLEGMIEFDEGYFEKAMKEVAFRKLKRRRGCQRLSKVTVMAEFTKLEVLKTAMTSSHCRYFKMKLLESHRKDEINELVSSALDGKSIVFSDQSTSYVDIENYVEMHLSKKNR